MVKKKSIYIRPAIRTIVAEPNVMYEGSKIIHQRSLSSTDGDITVDEYEEDETVEVVSIYDYVSAAKLATGGVWDEEE